MQHRLRSLSGILAFDAAARHSSLTLAAKELGRTQSAVSQQVKALEDQLGFALFIRKPREIVLTADGRILAKAISKSLSGLDQTLNELEKRHNANVIKLSVYHSFANHWLIPRLPVFNAKHPELDIQVNADDHIVDLSTEGHDLAVRKSVGRNVTPSAIYVGKERYVPVYAPVLSPNADITLDNITRFDLLGYEDTSYWTNWFALNNVTVSGANFGQTYSHSGLLVQAAIVGAGISLVSTTTAAEALRTGQVKCVRGRPLDLDHCFSVIPRKSPMSPSVQVFADWLQNEFHTMQDELENYFS